ncbi:peptidase S53 [Mycolicibacterium flavescens]|uniref:S53 family peptidase n=1 Tax=Mycolicibacterium flavescens TaxID=1776 RepID=UPI000A8C286B|nr:S53 family peptidase [Mycolicibacterium flavescens]MCV7282046.1 peptidase S53 [Mycolicibacterium flavescens]
MSARQLGVLALIAVGVWALAADLRPDPARDGGGVIPGPYSYLLASSTDLGPSRTADVQVTLALGGRDRPDALFDWAGGRDLAVRWHAGQDWAVVEGRAQDVADAFDVEVHDYRGRRGQVFYASPQQPGVPDGLTGEVRDLGRILGYLPHRTSHIWTVPLDVPDQGLTPEALLNTYNITPLAAAGYTGKGTTIVFFAFDGFDQADLDTFADTYRLPRFTPEVVGGELDEPRGETTMDLQVAHAVAPDARKVVVSAQPTVTGDGAFEKIGQMFAETDRRFPGAVWSLSIGWGCDKLITAADLAPVRAALAAAQERGTTAFNASGDLAGLECKGGDDWSSPPGEADIGLDSIASLPEMTDVGGTTLSTDAQGRWLSEQAWFDVPLTVGTGGGVSALFDRPPWQRAVMTGQHSDRRLTPDVAAVADPFTGVRIVFQQTPLVGGGTSQSAPIWAGMAAVMNQYLIANGGRGIGALNPLLYRMARGAPLPAFRDVTLGGNSVADATPGYDLVTGLGTPDVDNLVRNLLVLQRVPS